MSGPVYDWLPLEAAAPQAVVDALDEAVQGWGRRWFNNRRMRLSGVAPARRLEAFAGPDSGWRVCRGVAAINCSRSSAARLLEWSLDQRPDQAVVSPADRQLLRGFEDRMIDDLAEAAADVLGAGGGAPSTTRGQAGGIMAGVAQGGSGPLLTIALPLEALAPLAKRSLPRRKAATAPLSALLEALGSTLVELDATLGQAEISIGELRGLEPGDILVLNTKLDGPAALAWPDGGEVVARGRLSDSDGRRALIVQH